MMKKFRNTMIAGLLALLPIYLSFAVLIWLFKEVDEIFQPWLAQVFHITLPGLGILLTVLIIFVTGAIVSSVSGSLVLEYFDRMLDHVPVVKGLYSGIKKVVDSFNPNNPTGFKEFVLVEQPETDTLAAGFLTGEFSLAKPDGTQRELAVVYVPSNHLYLGTIQIVDRPRIIKTSLSVQDGVAFSLSAGASAKGTIQGMSR